MGQHRLQHTNDLKAAAVVRLDKSCKAQGSIVTEFGITRCLLPRFNGAICSLEWKEALWDKYVTAAP